MAEKLVANEDMSLEWLLAKYPNEEDVKTIQRVYGFAGKAHQGQVRISGEPYFTHCLATACILADLGMGADVISAGLMHDIVEDTEVTVEDVERMFGRTVAKLVDGVTKLRKLEGHSRTERQAQTYHKMFVAMTDDIRVILIKFADRLHNMRTLGAHTPEKQKEIAGETLDFYAPLAHRLGVYRVKNELEDLALFYTDPEKYRYITDKLSELWEERGDSIKSISATIRAKLKEAGITAAVTERLKHIYSIYMKMKKQNVDVNEIYDLVALRVIVKAPSTGAGESASRGIAEAKVEDTPGSASAAGGNPAGAEESGSRSAGGEAKAKKKQKPKEDPEEEALRWECYSVLAILLATWDGIDERYKNYFRRPKGNGYQSIHTSFHAGKGNFFEVQIRTEKMHRIAEYGIAAHWRYKEGLPEKDEDKYYAWIRESVEWQSETESPDEFLKTLKLEMFASSVFVFTPKGDPVELPSDATVLDFAYRVHTGVGHQCVGCKVNGVIVPLTHGMKNGDIVEVMTSGTSPGPKQDWLKIVRTARARTKIRNWFNSELHGDYLENGRKILGQALLKLGPEGKSYFKTDGLFELVKYFECGNFDYFLLSLGSGEITPANLNNRLKEEFFKNVLPVPSAEELEAKINEEGARAAKRQEAETGRQTKGIVLRGADNLMTHLSHCCNPLPGDDILGYVTRGRGVSIHRRDCANARYYLREEGDRIVDVSWDEGLLGSFTSELIIEARDRTGLTSDILALVTNLRLHIHEIHSREVKNGMALATMKLEIKNMDHLNYVIDRLMKIKNVTAVHRVIPGKTNAEEYARGGTAPANPGTGPGSHGGTDSAVSAVPAVSAI